MDTGADGNGRDAGTDGSEGSMRERADENRLKLYVLLEANRWVVTAGILAAVFATMVAVAVLTPVDLRTIVERGDPVSTLFQALTTSIITGVTLVVTITQLIVSQELGPLGDQRDRMAGTLSFRTDAAEYLDAPVSPHAPSAFVSEILAAVSERGRSLEAAADPSDARARERIASFVAPLTAEADRVRERLDDAQFGTFVLLSAALDFNYSVKLYDARRLRREYGDALGADAGAALADIEDLLGLFAPAREHVKTLYFQWELANLSREILYATVPALAVAMVSLLFLDTPATITGVTLGVDSLVWVVAGAATLALAPFALLLAYVLRIVTIAKRTLAIGPFVLRDVDRDGGVDWDDGR